nr:vacuolar calcium ion transporter [Quercus suber]
MAPAQSEGTSAASSGHKRSPMQIFKRKDTHPPTVDPSSQSEKGQGQGQSAEGEPQYNEEGHRINHNGHKVTKGIQPDGESGRSWVHPLQFLGICWRSSCTASSYTNIFWPFTIAALVLYFNYRETHGLAVFACAYIGMVPAANLVGFAGQELARKLPKVAGVILETTFGSVVEIILFMILLKENDTTPGEGTIPVIRAAILGSILANVLFCLVGLIIPTVFYNSLISSGFSEDLLEERALKISYATAIVLLFSFCVYVWFQSSSHHGLYEDILEADEERDHDRHKDLAKAKLTFTESIAAVVIALTFVSLMAYILVKQIPTIQEHGVSDSFLGLILVPVVEKAAEHITAVDEAYDNQMNFALSHVLGASIQTALLNTPLVVLVGWGLDIPMSLKFEIFNAVMLILAIIVVGSFLRDEKSDYLEGALCVFVYILIAVSAWYYPNAGESSGGEEASSVNETAAEAVTQIARYVLS